MDGVYRADLDPLPQTVRKYRRETLDRTINLAWGRGSLIVDGGVISVLVVLGIAIGGMVAIEAWATLNIMGFGALSGIVGGLANVRGNGSPRRWNRVRGPVWLPYDS